MKTPLPDIMKLQGVKPGGEPTLLMKALVEQKFWEQAAPKMNPKMREAFLTIPGAHECRKTVGALNPALKDWKWCTQRSSNTPDIDSGRIVNTIQDPRGWLVRATAEADPEAAIDLAQGFAEVMLSSLRPAER